MVEQPEHIVPKLIEIVIKLGQVIWIAQVEAKGQSAFESKCTVIGGGYSELVQKLSTFARETSPQASSLPPVTQHENKINFELHTVRQ